MPTYRYRCAKCGEQFEAWQSIHDDALTVHDGACGGTLTKVLAVGGIVLKGPGFYRTDSRAKPAGKERGEGEGAKPDTSKPDTSKPDTSKPDSSKSDSSGGNGSGGSKKGQSGSKSETTTSGASKSDSSTS